MSVDIAISGVAKTFGHGTTALDAVDDIDLTVRSGETVTLLGPSGCGKTTLLRLIAGLERPTRGRISIGGEAPEQRRSRKQIGFVPQSPALLPWRTVRANASLLLDVNRRANASSPTDRPSVDDLLTAVGLGDFTDALPHELSGGMQQRVALVRGFVLGAAVLLMDEPFAALDEITRADMRHLLAELNEPLGTTVVFVTHSVAEAAYLSDRVAVMSPRPGRIIDIVDIDLPHPRTAELEDTSDFFELTTRLRTALRDGVDS